MIQRLLSSTLLLLLLTACSNISIFSPFRPAQNQELALAPTWHRGQRWTFWEKTGKDGKFERGGNITVIAANENGTVISWLNNPKDNESSTEAEDRKKREIRSALTTALNFVNIGVTEPRLAEIDDEFGAVTHVRFFDWPLGKGKVWTGITTLKGNPGRRIIHYVANVVDVGPYKTVHSKTTIQAYTIHIAFFSPPEEKKPEYFLMEIKYCPAMEFICEWKFSDFGTLAFDFPKP